MNAATNKKYYTVEEVNQRLPLVRAILQDIVKLYHDVHERRQRLLQIRQLPGVSNRNEDTPYSEEVLQIEEELDKDIDHLQEFVDELNELGAELKDPMVGLVDFLTVLDGREVYLCWKLGEEEVAYWHELDSGYQGRQSLYENLVSGEPSADEGTGEDPTE